VRPQRLKPLLRCSFTARLKSCPSRFLLDLRLRVASRRGKPRLYICAFPHRWEVVPFPFSTASLVFFRNVIPIPRRNLDYHFARFRDDRLASEA